MLKNILNLEGAQQLSKNEQSSISGGKYQCASGSSYCANLWISADCCHHCWDACGFGWTGHPGCDTVGHCTL